jgi:SAM-dependent methyltransferase
MTDWKQKTVDTYNKSAVELAEYFKGIGPRVKDIEKAFELAGNRQNPNVLEIGCGDGRDAKEIVKYTTNYIGFDISSELIKIARGHAPGVSFEVADAVSYKYPKDLDVVFAFAALLHLDKYEVAQILKLVHISLKPGGIFYISLKYMPEYIQKVKKDKYGERLFYFYNPTEIQDMAGKYYETVLENRQKIGDTDWFTIALRNK